MTPVASFPETQTERESLSHHWALLLKSSVSVYTPSPPSATLEGGCCSLEEGHMPDSLASVNVV